MRNKFKLFVFFIAISAFGFAACSDDDDDKKESEFEASAIVGEWDIDEMTTTVVSSEGTETGVENPEVWLNFKEDGSGIASNDVVFTWSLSDNLLSLQFVIPEDGAAGPPAGGPGAGYNFDFEDLAAFEKITLTVTDLDESYMAVEYVSNYPGISVSMVMELSR